MLLSAAHWKDFLLGGVSGAVAKTLTAPLGYTKLAIQVQEVNPKVRRGEVPRYEGFIDCFLRIYREEGLLAFYRGHVASCLRYFPTQLFNLYTKDIFKRFFPKYNPKTQFPKFFAANLLSGGFAASCSLVVIYPWDVINQARIIDAIDGKKPRDVPYYIKKMVAKRGICSLWTGIGVSIAGILTYRGIQLAAFDKMTGLNPWKKEKGWFGTLSCFVTAQIAINIGAFLTYPFDTIRRLLQWQDHFDENEDLVYEGPIDCAKKVFDKDGFAGFYKGFGASCFASVTGAVAITFYVQMRKYLKI